MRFKISLMITIILGLLLSACNVEKFDMPTWDVTLNVPMMNENYYVSELIDSVNFFPAPDNGLLFRTTGEIRTEDVGNIAVDTGVSTDDVPILSGINTQTEFPFSDVQNGRELAYGLIGSGKIWCDFSNIDLQTTEITLTFDEILDENNQALVIDFDGTAGLQETDLTGYHIGTPGSDTIVETVHVSINSASGLPNGSLLGQVSLLMNEDITFSSFRGRLTNYRLVTEENSTSIDIDYPWGLDDAIELTNASIRISIVNPIEFPCVFYGDFYAINTSTGETASIPVIDENDQRYIIPPAVNGIPSITEIEFVNQVDQLLQVMPEHVDLRDSYFLITNTNNQIGSLDFSQQITGEYVANAPFRFILYPALISPQDSVEIEISADNRKTIEENILNAHLELMILNKLPAGADATVYFSLNPNLDPTDASTWAFSKFAVIDSYQDNPNEQPVSLDVTYDELMLFTNPKVYMKATFRFDASDGPITITASPADYIRIRGMIRVLTHVEEQ